ncbi:efflux RND transporter periplasmic adaptor subunit [Prosthecobacter dejongeii]|uniref:RND family efflux transporter MFP subunit n=1 Tax=Prosthecobacter dejongeii TaxID=48465 RepID=A0A7W7YPY3_9BACT|nr:HlyD family efflux transporter periplasmic adaptor subunit [Prosthecobacter dejongeii]MBB5040164.1 RND family efflux transporter MFP subunit [Prosthecobacter dejongeii]
MNIFPLVVRYGTIAVAVFGVFSMTQVLDQIRAQETAIPPPPVKPPEKPVGTRLAATGIIEAREENVAIGTPIAGLVTKVLVKVSQQVDKGDALLQLDDRELQAQLIQAQASIAVNQAQLDVALAQKLKVQDNLDRLKSITDQRAVSQDDVRNRSNDLTVAQAQVGSAEAQLAAAQADVKQIQMLIERLTIRAPRPGTILQVNIREGEFASIQNRLAAMILGDLDKLQIRADVDEQNATQVRKDEDAVAYVKGDSKSALPLKFVRIEPFVIPKQSLTGASTERVDTRVLQVIYELSIPEGKQLYVGQQVDVMIGGEKATPPKS